jgi:SpoVK/Ycf46/Vps4 family AAA+-type ATPase
MKLRDKDSLISDISKLTPGYVGADLLTLCREASLKGVERIVS